MYVEIALMVCFGICLAFSAMTVEKIKDNDYPRPVVVKKGADIITVILMMLCAGVALSAAVYSMINII